MNVAIGRLVLVIGRSDQIFATFALVDTGGPNVLERDLPTVHDCACDRALIRRRDLEHHGAYVLRIEERHEVNGVGFGVRNWFFQSHGFDQKRIWLTEPWRRAPGLETSSRS